jgi:hypothetical protein
MRDLGNIYYCCMTGNVSNPNKSGVGGICGKNDNQISDVTFYGNVSVDHSQDNIWVGDLEYNGHSSLTKQHPNPDNEFEDDEALNNYLATIPVEHALYRQAVKYPLRHQCNHQWVRHHNRQLWL